MKIFIAFFLWMVVGGVMAGKKSGMLSLRTYYPVTSRGNYVHYRLFHHLQNASIEEE